MLARRRRIQAATAATGAAPPAPAELVQHYDGDSREWRAVDAVTGELVKAKRGGPWRNIPRREA